MIRVKVCGITNLEDALVCTYEGADALGFIFYKRSPRYISFSSAERIIKKIDPFVSKVGVFVNEDREKVLKIACNIGLDVVQLHGEEDKNFCSFLKKRIKVIKAFFPKKFSLEFKKYKVDAYLFDVRFEDKLKRRRDSLEEEIIKKLSSFTSKMRIIISGGLNCQNIKRVLTKIQPYAVDVARGVEKYPGKKNKELVKKFIRIVKRYEVS